MEIEETAYETCVVMDRMCVAKFLRREDAVSWLEQKPPVVREMYRLYTRTVINGEIRWEALEE